MGKHLHDPSESWSIDVWVEDFNGGMDGAVERMSLQNLRLSKQGSALAPDFSKAK